MSKFKNENAVNYVLCFIYGCLTLFFIPHLPILFLTVLATLCFWNTRVIFANKNKPAANVANILAGCSLGLMFYSIGMSDTVLLFVAMLLLASLFKLLQAKTKKHYQVITTLTFFSLSSVYLFNQDILITLAVSSLFILNFAVLGLLESTQSLNVTFKKSGKLLLMALPLAVLLLLFLPKIPAFWQLPGPQLAKTGLSEDIDPFNIAKLANSDELVFRATFTEPLPNSPYYWRAIIHDEFDGNAWLTSDYIKYNKKGSSDLVTDNSAPIASYSVIVEPSSQKWLYGLAYSTSNTHNVNSNYQGLLNKENLNAKSIQYSVTSFSLKNLPLTLFQKKHYTQLKTTENSKTNNLVKQLKSKTKTDRELYKLLLNYFSNQSFTYTLTPTPMSGEDTIDQFMFENKRGFCGHYASAAAYIFRRAGLAARVVSGYLGGEYNKNTGVLTIRQYDAHAWVEVFIENKGWTIFDATAVVAPERLTGSLSQNQPLNTEFKSNLNFGLVSLSQYQAINWLRLELEALDYKWSSWVVGFDEQKQNTFLKSLFGKKYIWLVPLSLLLICVISFTAYFIYLNWPVKKVKDTPPIVKAYNDVLKIAKSQKINPAPTLTPTQTLDYIALKLPKASKPLYQFKHLFNQVRYGHKPFTKERKTQAKDLIKLIKSSK